MVVKDGDGVALAAQLVRGRQTRGAAADDGDFLARGFFSRLEFDLVRNAVVADELFDRIDTDILFDGVAVAARLAGRRAHTTHHGGERVGLGGAMEGVFLPLHILGRLLDAAHDVEPAADVFSGRAACLAGRSLVHVGRALVGGISREDTGLEGWPFLIAVFVLAVRESSIGCLGFVCGSCHCESPDLNNSDDEIK